MLSLESRSCDKKKLSSCCKISWRHELYQLVLESIRTCCVKQVNISMDGCNHIERPIYTKLASILFGHRIPTSILVALKLSCAYKKITLDPKCWLMTLQVVFSTCSCYFLNLSTRKKCIQDNVPSFLHI